MNFRTVSPTTNGFLMGGHFCFAGLGGCVVDCAMGTGKGAVGNKGMSLSVRPRNSGRLGVGLGKLGPGTNARCFMSFMIAAARPRPLVPTKRSVTSRRFHLPVRPLTVAKRGTDNGAAIDASNSVVAMLSPHVRFIFGGEDKLIASCGMGNARCFTRNFNVRPGF